MADLRLLAATTGLMLLASDTGCAPLHAPALAGRLVDATSKQPVAGAEIFTSREAQYRAPGEPSTSSFGDRWTTTDADGRFAFERETIDRWFPWILYRVRPKPDVLFLHRRYGAFYLPIPDDPSQWTALVFEVAPDPGTLRLFESRRSLASLCTGWHGPACRRMCLLAYEDSEYCERESQ